MKFDSLSSCKRVGGRAFCSVIGVCPISGGAANATRNTGFLVSLMGFGLRIDGQVHAHQIKSLEWASRQATLVERAPDAVVQEVLACLHSVLE